MARKMISSWRELIDLWPVGSEFSKDCGRLPNWVQVVRLRGACPSTNWPKIIEGAKRRGIPGIDAALLLHIDQSEEKRRKKDRSAA
jgi:hypothetical protein